MLIRRRYVRRVARMVVEVRSGMVVMLGLRRERFGRRRRCPRPVVRPVAFIGAIHLQGRISSTRPEESLPPSTHGDTKVSDTDMAILIPASTRDTLDSNQSLFRRTLSASLPQLSTPTTPFSFDLLSFSLSTIRYQFMVSIEFSSIFKRFLQRRIMSPPVTFAQPTRRNLLRENATL